MNFCPHCGGNLQGVTGTNFASCPDEVHCDWTRNGNEYTCPHGARMKVHPVGYCNGGCCR